MVDVRGAFADDQEKLDQQITVQLWNSDFDVEPVVLVVDCPTPILLAIFDDAAKVLFYRKFGIRHGEGMAEGAQKMDRCEAEKSPKRRVAVEVPDEPKKRPRAVPNNCNTQPFPMVSPPAKQESVASKLPAPATSSASDNRGMLDPLGTYLWPRKHVLPMVTGFECMETMSGPLKSRFAIAFPITVSEEFPGPAVRYHWNLYRVAKAGHPRGVNKYIDPKGKMLVRDPGPPSADVLWADFVKEVQDLYDDHVPYRGFDNDL
ncbi:hypothetical protein DXG01_004094 [Tephrocybe rancida]|nr:hypothetical protein DXG01_004094 [Tephrocybe rancida]